MGAGILEDSQWVTELLNGTITALKNVVPIKPKIAPPEIQDTDLELSYGVLIGFTGDLKGNLVIRGDLQTFGAIGQEMFGMPLQDEMLRSFTGEFGNMLAGSLATLVSLKGWETDITAPTIVQGQSTLSGYEKSIKLPIVYDQLGNLDIFLMMKQ